MQPEPLMEIFDAADGFCGSEDSAGFEGADPGAEQPGQAAYMIDMGVAEKNMIYT